MSRWWSVLSQLAFFGLLVALLVLSAGGHLVFGDEETMFRVTQNLLGGRGFAVGQEQITVVAQTYPAFIPRAAETYPTTSAVPGRDGQLYSKYGIGQSLLSIPLYLFGMLLARLGIVPTEAEGARQAVAMFNPLALAACGWLVAAFGRALGYRLLTARVIALALVCTTFAWPYVKTFYPQPAAMALDLTAVYAAYRWRDAAGRRWLWIMALAWAFAILVRASEAIIMPALVLYLATATPTGRRWRGLAALVAGVGMGLAASSLYDWMRFGSLVATGYHEVAWNTPVALGLYGLLVSPGKGVVLYAPLLLLGLGAWLVFLRRRRAEALLMAGLWVSCLALYAPYNFWTGGFNWGPRFLLPVLPFGFLPLGALLEGAARRLAWLAFALLFAAGLAIQAPAILVDQSRYLYQQLADLSDTRAYDRTLYLPDSSPVVRQGPVALALLRDYSQPVTWQTAAHSLHEIAADPGLTDIPNGVALAQAEFLRRNTIDLWWLSNPLRDAAYARPWLAAAPWVLVGLGSALVLRIAHHRV